MRTLESAQINVGMELFLVISMRSTPLGTGRPPWNIDMLRKLAEWYLCMPVHVHV